MPGRSTEELNRTRRAGKLAQQAAVAWLQAHGFPGAGYEIRNRSNDLTGIGDIGGEVTITGWDKIWMKLDQARRDTVLKGFDAWFVWKKRNGVADPGKWSVTQQADVFWMKELRLQKLEARELDADDQFARGFTAGVTYARKHPAPTTAEEAV